MSDHLDRTRADYLAALLLENIMRNISPNSPGQVYEALLATAVVVATILESTRDDGTMRMWFDNEVDSEVVDFKNSRRE